MIGYKKMAKVTFFYKIDKPPVEIYMKQSDLFRDINRILERKGVYRYFDQRVDLTILNKIEIEFVHEQFIN